MPAQPENVDTLGSTSVVVSTRGHAVTILRGLRVVETLRGFGAPHVAGDRSPTSTMPT